MGLETLSPTEMTVDELATYGMEPMDDEEVESYLTARGIGVLGFPAAERPYLLPMSYGYDGGSRLYFFYVLGDSSRKEDLSRRAETASFLVYSAETMYNWRSVQLAGTIRPVPDDERASLTERQTPSWRPELFETASETERTGLYEFRIEEWTGLKQTDLPPGFYGRPGDDQGE